MLSVPLNMNNKTLKGLHRKRLVEQLHARFAKSTSMRQRLRYWRKKYLWLLVVEGTRLAKRALDVIVATFLLIVLAPVFLAISLIIKLQDGGPVFYTAPRVGKWGREFSFPKFRTMIPDAAEKKGELKAFSIHGNDVNFKMERDPRVTPFGNLLRKSSLDELPQLWTILKGEMTLVGPRPPLPEEVAVYNLEQRKRLDATPGLTCIWQVTGRSEIPFQRQVELDIAYIESQSLLLDLKLLLKTIPAVIFGRGAY